jgi:hypothetical protein
MEEPRGLRVRATTRHQAAQAATYLRLQQQREAGIMWAQGLFMSCRQACAHFGLSAQSKTVVRYHYSTFAKKKHDDEESQALNTFYKSSVPQCSVLGCPCRVVLGDSSGNDACSVKQMDENSWKKLQSLLQCKEKADQQVADEFFQSTGVKRSRSAIQKYRMLKLKKKPSMGRPTFLPHTAEYKIIDAIKLMRASKVPVYSMHVAMLAKRLAAQLGLDEKLSFGRKWVHSFLQRHSQQLGTTAQTIIEDLRAHYCTASKLAKHYQIVSDTLVALGWAVRNEKYDASVPVDTSKPTDPRNLAIIINPVFAHRIVSFDETRFTLNQSKEGKGPAKSGQKTVIVKDELTGAADDWKIDTGEVIMNKSSYDCTIAGGSSADGNALPALYIFAGGFDPANDMKGAPKCGMRFDANGDRMEAYGWHNEKGGMTDEVMLMWLDQVLLPCFPDVSPDKPILLICDGYGSHLCWEFIQRCIATGVHVILRPPHTSHLTQGEDVRGGHFHTFHNAERVAKLNLTQRLLLSPRTQNRKLQRSHIMAITSAAWEQAFDVTVCQRAWQAIGIYPHFDRRPYWQQFQREQAAENLNRSVQQTMEQRQQQREEVAVAAEVIDARNILVLSPDSASDSEGEGVSGRKKRRNNSSQYALLGPITFGAALEKRKALEAAREQQQQQQVEQRAIRDQEVRAAQDKLREAGRAMDYKLTNDALRWDVAALTKSEYVALLFYLGKSLGEVGLAATSKAADVRCALLQFVATQPSLSYSARAQAALVAIQEPAAHPASAAAVANVIQ